MMMLLFASASLAAAVAGDLVLILNILMLSFLIKTLVMQLLSMLDIFFCRY